MNKRPSMETSFVMLSGDFGQLMKNDISIQKWRMNLLFLRKRSPQDSKLGIVQKILKCLDLDQLSIKN
jgi:hypothetical protein